MYIRYMTMTMQDSFYTCSNPWHTLTRASVSDSPISRQKRELCALCGYTRPLWLHRRYLQIPSSKLRPQWMHSPFSGDTLSFLFGVAALSPTPWSFQVEMTSHGQQHATIKVSGSIESILHTSIYTFTSLQDLGDQNSTMKNAGQHWKRVEREGWPFARTRAS